MSWAEGAIRRVIALHERTPQNTCLHCLEGFSYVEAQEWPCETLQAVWQLGLVEGPQQAPVQGPAAPWNYYMDRNTARLVEESTAAMQRIFPGITPSRQPVKYSPLKKHAVKYQITTEALELNE